MSAFLLALNKVKNSGVFEMTGYCIGTCIQSKAKKPLEIGRYAAGQKRCNICEIFINSDGAFCPCCKGKLRSLPRSRKGKEKYLLQKSGLYIAENQKPANQFCRLAES